MSDRVIHILPEQVASQIAAGEVVERPASALKELVENSLDAGARSIAVEIVGGGGGLISITDDGAGMSRHDALLSIRRHATSKIRDAGDLTRIRTLGFRGEALASIASVSRMELKTRRNEDDCGFHLKLAGGETVDSRECAMAPGTTIEVRELFFNTPARLKFLKTPATEQGAIGEAMQRLALGNPQVAFSLVADGRRLLELPRAASQLERIRQLFGIKQSERLLPVERAREGLRVTGFASVSQESFPTPRMVFTFVNRRAVRDRMLARAIAQAYATLIPRGRHPAAVLFLELRPEDVDVNVHPMKTEVRFRHSSAVFEAVYHTLRDRLADQTISEGASPRPAAPVGSTAAATPEAAAVAPAELQAERRLRLVSDNPALPARSEQRALGLGFRSASPERAVEPSANGSSLRVVAGSEGGAGVSVNVPIYSRLRIVGQFFAGYIALESDDALLLVDQHAAHERVTFEKLRAELKSGGIRVQPRLVPHAVELNPMRAAQVQAAIPQLSALGFELEPFGPATLLLKGAPAVFDADDGVRLLADMIQSVGEAGNARQGEEVFEGLLKQLACHGSVRVGRTLAESEMRALLEELDRTEFKTNCPHGRPVHIKFPLGHIERMFRR